MNGFRVTYEIVTHESAEHGDAESRGFIEPGGWRTPVDEAIAGTESFGMSLREAVRLAYPIEDSGYWWTGESEQDCRTGAYEVRSIHPPESITPASYERVTRLLGIR